MELHEQLDQVKHANTFLAFAHALAERRGVDNWDTPSCQVPPEISTWSGD